MDGGTVDPTVLRISVTEFKAKCLGIFDQLERRKLARVIVTRRGKVVGEVTPKSVDAAEEIDIWGAHRGSATFAADFDPTESVWDDSSDEDVIKPGP